MKTWPLSLSKKYLSLSIWFEQRLETDSLSTIYNVFIDVLVSSANWQDIPSVCLYTNSKYTQNLTSASQLPLCWSNTLSGNTLSWFAQLRYHRLRLPQRTLHFTTTEGAPPRSVHKQLCQTSEMILHKAKDSAHRYESDDSCSSRWGMIRGAFWAHSWKHYARLTEKRSSPFAF